MTGSHRSDRVLRTAQRVGEGRGLKLPPGDLGRVIKALSDGSPGFTALPRDRQAVLAVDRMLQRRAGRCWVCEQPDQQASDERTNMVLISADDTVELLGVPLAATPVLAGWWALNPKPGFLIDGRIEVTPGGEDTCWVEPRGQWFLQTLARLAGWPDVSQPWPQAPECPAIVLALTTLLHAVAAKGGLRLLGVDHMIAFANHWDQNEGWGHDVEERILPLRGSSIGMQVQVDNGWQRDYAYGEGALSIHHDVADALGFSVEPEDGFEPQAITLTYSAYGSLDDDDPSVWGRVG